MDPSVALPLLLGLSRSRSRAASKPGEADASGPSAFARRLHRILSSRSEAVEWRPHGRAFRVLDFDPPASSGPRASAREKLEERLAKEGFRRFRGGRDEGCFWREGFTRAECGDPAKAAGEPAKGPAEEASDARSEERVYMFLSLTCSTDAAVARRYLEMASDSVEAAITLFLDGGGDEPDGGGDEPDDGAEGEPDFWSAPRVPEAEPRPLSPAGEIVRSALREYRAYGTLRRGLLRWIGRRRATAGAEAPGADPAETPPRPSVAPPPRDLRGGTSHFLFRSLVHPSLPVRRAASRILLEGLRRLPPEGREDAEAAARGALALSFHRVAFGEAPGGGEGDPAVQPAALLLSLVCGGFGEAGGSAERGIESFVAGGGLRWACGSVVRLARSLVRGGEGGDDRSGGGGGGDDEAVRSRLVLLVDLVYRLVLFGSVPRAPEGASADGGEGWPPARRARAEDAEGEARRSRRAARFCDAAARAAGDPEASRTAGPGAGPGAPPARAGDGGAGGGGGGRPGPDVAEENRARREGRKAALEKVHGAFWKTALPAAVCVGPSPRSSEGAADADAPGGSRECRVNFSPLACLVAAYEMLRSPSAARGRFDDATNKAVSVLSRLVDPAAGQALVVSDPEIHWGLASLFDELSEGKGAEKGSGKPNDKGPRKRDRDPSHASQEGRSRPSPARAAAAAAFLSQEDAGPRPKRQRTRRTHTSSLLERLTDPSRDAREGSGGASPYAASGSLYSAARYRSALESVLLRGAAAAGSSSAASANRDGSLSRIVAAAEERSGLGGSAGIRARAALEGRSPGDSEWRMLGAMEEKEDADDVDGDEVVMMEDDDDTEFEQDQEDEAADDMDDLPDGPDDDGGDDDDDDDDGDDGDENGDDTDEGEGDDLFDDAVIVMDQVTNAVNDDCEHQRNNPHRHQISKGAARAGAITAACKNEHEQAYLRAAMEILTAQYLGDGDKKSRSSLHLGKSANAFSIFAQPPAIISSPLLTLSAEQSLLQSMCDIVKPPKKPLNLKIFMRRAPTQEEFFRGALSRNPINLSSLKAGTSGGDDRTSSDEPTFADLRNHIAKDLQMEDSAELLELLVASKIIDVNMKLRVCQQVLWKKYVMENSTSVSSMVSGAGPGHQMINTGSGLSMIFSSSGLGGRVRGSGADELDVTQLPPMVVTYRLAGVDGEATEDKVEVADLEDPEATVITSPRALEKKMEKEFGITRSLANNGGISVMLASVQSFIDEVTTRIRRDEIPLKRKELSASDENFMRVQFAKSPPCPGLVLLRHCANLTENRKKLLAARAPTILLRMLLDILNAMNRSPTRRRRSLTLDGTTPMDTAETQTTRDTAVSSSAESNPTTNALQEIIEMLASDISAEVSDESSNSVSRSGSFVNLSQGELEQVGSKDDHATLPLVLKSLRSANLSPPLRKVISKLLPFLTYGQIDQSKELASYFNRYVDLEALSASGGRHDRDMMSTFVDTAIEMVSSPSPSVCDNLRQALITNGFVDKVRSFVMLHAPLEPPPWSPALYPKSSPPTKKSNDDTAAKSREEWRKFFDRTGLVEAIKILIGLCSKHHGTQTMLTEELNGGQMIDLPTLCHWVESTSDNESHGINMNGLGILAETLLDALKEGNDETSERINAIRKKTRDRKREIAEERRNRALVGLSAFGTLAGSAVSAVSDSRPIATAADSTDNRTTSMLASMFGLSAFASSSQTSQRKTRASAKDSEPDKKSQPSWMAEMEAMEEESGVTCVVCQEGRTLQPSELLGLYAYMKKVTIPASQGGGKGDIDGTCMLMSLPLSCPRSLTGSQNESFFQRGKAAANALHGTSQAMTAMAASSSISSASSSNRNYYITTVSAGNAIHCSCHTRAKAADRAHPKAPKSEWEGASLRNSRVTCNVILPLVSSKTSSVPLIAVENALGEVNTITTSILGVRPKMLWNVLHDVRLLLLRMAYGEALNADCGGGSSSSNFLLVLYQLYTADMLSTNAELDDSQVAKHARGLSPGFLAAVNIVDALDFDRQDTRSKRLERGVADAAPMAALCSILFFNSGDDSSPSAHDLTDTDKKAPSPYRQWELHKDKFLAGLLRCAGHRNSLGVNDSGCITARGISTGSRKNVERARSFMDWSITDYGPTASFASKKKAKGGSILEDYAVALRPMITLYAILNSLSREFVVNDTDENTLSASERLASSLESCHKASCIVDLLDVAEITMDHDVICKYFEKGLLI